MVEEFRHTLRKTRSIVVTHTASTGTSREKHLSKLLGHLAWSSDLFKTHFPEPSSARGTLDWPFQSDTFICTTLL